MRILSPLFCSVLGFIVFPTSTNWPLVQPVKKTVTFMEPGKSGTDIPLSLILKDTHGVPVYKLECHNGNYEDSSELNFSGNFQCSLFALKEGRTRASWNLLAAKTKDEQSSDWFNRGRMMANQLWGRCGDIPEYGRIRNFRLRKMLITLEFSNLKWSSKVVEGEHQLKQFTFTVSVVPDKDASTGAAKPVMASSSSNTCQ